MINVSRARGRTIAAVALVCSGLLVLSACSSSGGSGKASDSSPQASGSGGSSSLAGQSFSLVFDSSPDASKVVEFHAVELLAKQGVKTSTKFDKASPQVAIAELQRGDIDAYSEAVTGGLAAIIQGVKLTVFALAQPRQDYVLLSKPSIKTLSDLKGEKIGVSSITGVNSGQALYVLQKAGLKKGDAKLVVVGGQSTRAAALLAGRVDATMLSHLFAAKAEKQHYNALFDYTRQAPELYDDVVFSTPKWLSAHKDLAVAFNKAMLESFKWFNDPANADAVVDEALKIQPDADRADTVALFKTLRSADAYPNGSILSSDALNTQQQIYFGAGDISKTVPVDQWVDTSYADQAKSEEGGK